MKQVIMVLTVMLLFGSCSVAKQEPRYSKGYIPLKKFNGDTVSYVLRNFHDRKDQYIGKKLEVFFNDLEIPIGTNLCIPQRDSFARVMDLSFLPYDEFDRQTEKRSFPNMIYIEFNEPIPSDTLYHKVSKIDRGHWSSLSRDFFGQLTMKDIDLISYLKAEKAVKGSGKVQKSKSPKSQ